MLRLTIALAGCCGWLLMAQSVPDLQAAKAALAAAPENTTIVTFKNGRTLTAGKLRAILYTYPAAQQQAFWSDPKTFLDKWAVLVRLAELAEENKIDRESPTKDQLEQARTEILGQAEVNYQINQIPVEDPAIEQYYKANKEKYKTVTLEAIFVSFRGPAESSGRPEEEARQRAQQVLEKLRHGGDFKALVKEYSDDETSRAKDGVFGTFKPGDNIPDAIRAAIFKMAPGDISDVIRQQRGFYVFRTSGVTYQTMAEVRDQIFNDIRLKGFESWFEKVKDATQVTNMNPILTGGPR